MLDGRYYKTAFDGLLIHGIGYTFGFFNHIFPLIPSLIPLGNQTRLACFSKNGNLIYKNDDYKWCYDCENPTVDVKNISKDASIVNIQQIDRSISINFLDTENSLFTFYLYDITGKQVAAYPISDKKQLTIAGLNAGVFGYLIVGKNEKYTGKFIIK